MVQYFFYFQIHCQSNGLSDFNILWPYCYWSTNGISCTKRTKCCTRLSVSGKVGLTEMTHYKITKNNLAQFSEFDHMLAAILNDILIE